MHRKRYWRNIKHGIEFGYARMIKCGIDMKKFGIILILAGISLIAALSMDVARRNRSILLIESGVASSEIGFMRLFATVGTVLVIAGVSATVMDKRP
jgi:hypothetical protein